MISLLAIIVIFAAIYYLIKLNGENKEFRRQLMWLTDRVNALEKDLSTENVSEETKSETAKSEPLKTEEQVFRETIEEPVYEQPISQTENITEETIQPKTFINIEKDLSSRWMIWLGGVAFAIGGAFLVKYSIDAGLLSPAIRVTLGTIIGLTMAVTGEGIRQRRVKIGFLSEFPDYVPSAISAAGLFTAFAAIYASYAVYALIPPLIAFAALAALCFFSTGLAYFHGRFFAYLGIIGGLVVPAMVASNSPSAWTLFPYLLVVIASCLWISRKKAWADTVGVSLVFSMIWAILWIFSNWKMGDIIPVGIFLLILATLNMLLLSGASPARSSDMTLNGLIPSHPVTIMSDAVTLISIILLISIVRLEHYSTAGMILISLGLIGQAFAVHKSPENDMGGVISIFGILFLLGSWHIPDIFEIRNLLSDAQSRQFIWSPITPPGFQTFTTACVTFGGITSLAIFFRLPWLKRQALWASIGNLLPLAILIISYWRVKNLDTSLIFASIAALIALFLTYGTKYISDKSSGNASAPIAAYAAGATTAIALALSMVLREAWLSFALALELVALGYIWQKTSVDGLRKLALLLAVIVLVRLFLNASVFDYSPGSLPIINWLFYGYGLTSALFYVASKIFYVPEKEDRLMTVLNAGWIIILVAFITLEIRVLFSKGGGLLSDPSNLEIALQTINWSIATTILMWREIKDRDELIGILRRFMTLLSFLGLIIGGGLANNSFANRSNIGPLIIFNLQFLQFFIPALLYASKAYLAQLAEKPRSFKIYSGAAFLTFWFWISAEVHHAYHPYGGIYSASNWEGYTFSLVWLLYAIALIILGLYKRIEKIRMAGLGVLSIVVLKVFISDMSGLEGLARALSFMGLGAALIGIGYLYQKMKTID
ncbi:MAG: DUF2339 domain-containing protein [Emcibacteraceae bacterium]